MKKKSADCKSFRPNWCSANAMLSCQICRGCLTNNRIRNVHSRSRNSVCSCLYGLCISIALGETVHVLSLSSEAPKVPPVETLKINLLHAMCGSGLHVCSKYHLSLYMYYNRHTWYTWYIFCICWYNYIVANMGTSMVKLLCLVVLSHAVLYDL
jgi:hypothetical protein